MLTIHTSDHPNVSTPLSVCLWLQLPTCQLGLQQNISWRWEPGLLGNIQQRWTVVWPKRSSQFLLTAMECQHQPGSALCEFLPGQLTARQTCSWKVPAVTTRDVEEEAQKFYCFCFHIGYLTWRVSWRKSFVHVPMWIKRWSCTTCLNEHVISVTREYKKKRN